MYEKKLKVMVELQDKFNKIVHPEWYLQDYNYTRAIWVESAELMDHLGYKWWKHQKPDMNQVHMELVDIIHFGISQIIKDSVDMPERYVSDLLNTAVKDIEEMFAEDDTYYSDDAKPLVDMLASEAAAGEFNEYIFFQLCYTMNLPFDTLYKKYIGKNSLNSFRQSKGYKDGTYIKVWDGLEDNEVLTAILDHMPIDEHLYDNVLNRLEIEYAKVAGTPNNDIV